MELPNISEIELQYLDQWFSNIVDTINFDLQKIEGAVVALNMQLTNLDAAPIQSLKDALNGLVEDLNEGFAQVGEQFDLLDKRLTAIGG